MTRSALAGPQSGNPPRARFVTVVWGERHVRALVNLAWRTLLAPGNLPALRRRLDATYMLYIRDEDISIVESSPQLERLRELMGVEIIPFPASDVHENRYVSHATVWKGAVDRARAEGDIIFLVIPDMVFFDGTLDRWSAYVEQGKRAIFTIGTWVVEETFLPEFETRYPISQMVAAEVAPADGMDFLLRHMHPTPSASLVDSPNHLYHLDRLSECVPGQGMLSRVFSSQPLVFDPGHFQLDGNNRPINRFGDMVMDDVCSFSTGSLLHVSEFYFGQEPLSEERIHGLASWASENLGMSALFEANFDYVYARPDVVRDEAAWREASSRLDSRVPSILAMGAISAIWRFAIDHGCIWAGVLIAVATWREDLHRHLNAERGFTVFLPEETAFPDAFRGVAFPALVKRTAPLGLVPFILAHVVPERLYLPAGARVSLAPAGADEEGPRTLGGRHLCVLAPDAAPSPGVAAVAGQQRVGFGAVYRTDQLLVDPMESGHD